MDGSFRLIGEQVTGVFAFVMINFFLTDSILKGLTAKSQCMASVMG